MCFLASEAAPVKISSVGGMFEKRKWCPKLLENCGICFFFFFKKKKIAAPNTAFTDMALVKALLYMSSKHEGEHENFGKLNRVFSVPSTLMLKPCERRQKWKNQRDGNVFLQWNAAEANTSLAL